MPFAGWISYSLQATAAGQWLNVYDRRNNFVPYEIRSVGADQLLTAFVPFAKGDVFSIDCSVPGAGGSIYFIKAIGVDLPLGGGVFFGSPPLKSTRASAVVELPRPFTYAPSISKEG